MNWAWASSLDQIWRSPTFPMWLTLAAAGFFGIIMLITLLRAEKSVANGALTVITLLAIGVAVAATIRGFGPGGEGAPAETRSAQPAVAALPALACIDDLAGDAVLNACEKTLFGSPDSAAAAVAYAASQISRLTASGDVATAEKRPSYELQALRRAVERDRYGLMAYVMMARDHCTPSACAAFSSLADNHQVAANMDERLYENLITRYAPSWNAPPVPAPAVAGAGAGLMAGLPPSVPTGKPTNADFPSAASTPPVNIMTPEPTSTAPKPPAAAATSAPAPRPAPAASPAPAAKKQVAAKRAPAATAPVQIAPAPPATPSAQAPAAANE